MLYDNMHCLSFFSGSNKRLFSYPLDPNSEYHLDVYQEDADKVGPIITGTDNEKSDYCLTDATIDFYIR